MLLYFVHSIHRWCQTPHSDYFPWQYIILATRDVIAVRRLRWCVYTMVFRLKLHRTEARTSVLSCATCSPSAAVERYWVLKNKFLTTTTGLILSGIDNCSFRYLFDKNGRILLFVLSHIFAIFFFQVILLGLFFESRLMFWNTHS